MQPGSGRSKGLGKHCLERVYARLTCLLEHGWQRSKEVQMVTDVSKCSEM